MISTVGLLCGAGAGIGVALIVRELAPARPDLSDALRRLDPDRTPPPPPAGTLPAGPAALPDRVGERLLSLVGDSVRLPRRDLDLLRITAAQHLGKKAMWAAAGLLFPQMLQILLALAGARLPFAIPGIASLAFAGLLWIHPTSEVKQHAKAARREFRYAVASYLERVELARAARSGAPQALSQAAAVGDSWTFQRLRTRLEQAQLSGVSAWEALRQLADELGVPELARPAETLALAGEDGASVRATLQAQARQLRAALLADAKAEANTASEAMIIPVVALVVLMMFFVGYPAAMQILSS
ncbi:type II secretion system F family protein [Streptantibioticus parmotrematis]|uniref:type II secretion system F family protein n=1 Tax=Streptantibioticus parmotrematis TaxID=2873249 RepID=UPI00340EAF7E